MSSLYHPRYWPTWLGVSLMRLVVFIPYPVLQYIGVRIGNLLKHRFKRRRAIAEINADLCFPHYCEKQKAQFVDDVMVNSVLGLIETAYSWWGKDDDVLSRSEVIGLDLVEEAKARGKGVILIGAHFTTLDLSGRVLSMRTDVDVTYRKQNNLVMDHVVNSSRARSFNNLVEKREMRRMIKLLKSGRMIWYATDQDMGRKNSVFAPFFGVEAATITTLSKLVRMTGAKPLFYSHFRQGEGADTVYVGRITDPFGEGFTDDDLHNANLLNTSIENALKEDPSQYLWVHRRFKTRPDPEEPNFYCKKARRLQPSS